MAALFDSLDDPTRRAMVLLMAHGPATVSALADPLGITVTAVGQHLRILENTGLAESEKRGRARQLGPEGLQEIENWAREVRDEWNARLDSLGGGLDVMDAAGH